MPCLLEPNYKKNKQKRVQIFAAATLLFIEKGYAATSMDLIAKESGVSKQTIYSHFIDKEELFLLAIGDECKNFTLKNLSTGEIKCIRHFLIGVANKYLDMVTSKEAVALHRLCAYECRTYPNLSQLFYDAGPSKLIKDLSKLMRKLHDEGYLAVDNTYFAALQFMQAIRGEFSIQEEFNIRKKISDKDKQDYIEVTIDMFLSAYAR